jgi:hypothetical protein
MFPTNSHISEGGIMVRDQIVEILGHRGRLVSGSKGQYRWDNPRNVVVFNGNLCTKSQGKIWYGDIDVTMDENKLIRLAEVLGETVYVLYESDARFENEQTPKLEKAVYAVSEKGQSFWAADTLDRDAKGRLVSRPQDKVVDQEAEKEQAVRYLESEACQEKLYERTSLRLPWGKIKRLARKKSPLVKFWDFAREHFNVSDEDLFKKLKLTKFDKDQLTQLQSAWIDKYFDFLSDYRKQNELNWSLFLNGPDYFLHDPQWIKPGFAYWKKDADPEAESTAA